MTTRIANTVLWSLRLWMCKSAHERFCLFYIFFVLFLFSSLCNKMSQHHHFCEQLGPPQINWLGLWYWTSNCKTSKIYISVKPWLINSQQLVLLPAARTAVHQPGHVQHTPCNKQHNIRTQSNFRLIRRYHREGVASAPGFLFWISLTVLEKLCEANRNLSSTLRKVNKGGDQDAKERERERETKEEKHISGT